MEDKLYIGGSIGVPIVNYERKSILTEADISGNNDNNFDYATYTENLVQRAWYQCETWFDF